VEAAIRVLSQLNESVADVEQQLTLMLSSNRNILLRTDLFINVITMCVAMGTTVSRTRAPGGGAHT
jgi:hypothetical protein